MVGLVRAYQWTVRPIIGQNCRFWPSCSEYAIEAVREHGAVLGAGLAARRILRCNPWHPGGYDPVPACGCAGSFPGLGCPEAASAAELRGAVTCFPSVAGERAADARVSDGDDLDGGGPVGVNGGASGGIAPSGSHESLGRPCENDNPRLRTVTRFPWRLDAAGRNPKAL